MSDPRRSALPVPHHANLPSRRVALGLLVAVLVPASSARTAEALSDAPTLLIAGPEGGRLERWAQVLSVELLPGLRAGSRLNLVAIGGEDGVTGANQFATRGLPDGNTLLLVPGEAALAWLAGDPRARFDAARWLAVLEAVAPAVVVSRLNPAGLKRSQPIRVGMAGPISADLAALLAIELMGCVAVPVLGVADAAAGQQALATNAVDVMLLRGQGIAEQVAAATALGAAPLLALDSVDAQLRHPALVGVPGLTAMAVQLAGAPPAGPLFEAWRVVAAAAQTEYALVLPHLTPAALVALWRQAGLHAASAPGLQGAAPDMRTVTAPGAAPGGAFTQLLPANPLAIAALRAWLATRLNWRPA